MTAKIKMSPVTELKNRKWSCFFVLIFHQISDDVPAKRFRRWRQWGRARYMRYLQRPSRWNFFKSEKERDKLIERNQCKSQWWRLEMLHLQSEQLVVHPDCRKTSVKRKKNDSSNLPYAIPSKKLISEVDHFEWNVHCFICGEEALIDDRHSYITDCEMYKRSVEARTLSLKTTVLRHCSRLGDSAENVFNRVNGGSDLVAAGARYHKQCFLVPHHTSVRRRSIKVGPDARCNRRPNII